MNEIEKLKQTYVGKKVYAGSIMKGYYGTIVDVVPDEDGFEPWFIVSEDENPNYTKRWNKHELQKIIVTTKLVPLD